MSYDSDYLHAKTYFILLQGHAIIFKYLSSGKLPPREMKIKTHRQFSIRFAPRIVKILGVCQYIDVAQTLIKLRCPNVSHLLGGRYSIF